MHPRPRLPLLGARACALGLVAACMGAWGHVHAGGGDPSPAQLLLVWVAASALSAGFLLKEAGWVRIAALLLGEQLLIHTALMWMVGMPASSMPGMPSMPGMGPMSGHDMSPVPSVSMLVGHAVAAAIAGLWLWRGERAMWTLIALAGASLRVLWRPCVVAAMPAVSVPRVEADLLPLWGLRRARDASRRGPPALAAL